MSRPTFQLYNSMTRAVEPLQPLGPPRVSLYVCGPTIYNYGHIGNFRTYVAVDLLRRALRHFGYAVDHVMQFTDVDDKTIRGAREKNLPLKEFTAIYRRAFLEDAKVLNIEIPDRTPNATDHVPAMIALIQKLIDGKSAYVSDDGSVYFRIASFPKYGCLCHLDLAGLMTGARVNQDEYEKEGVGDFVLWKKWTPADGDVGWDSPWGRGRPGWHIECSALSMEHLGEQIDIHGGGTDLRFPHHENEIAQSEAATGKRFVGHWFHVEHLLVDGQKMSKSLGNMYTVRDVLARGYTGRELRYALLSGANYAKNLNFTWQGMDDAKTALSRIDEWRKRIRDRAVSEPESAAKVPMTLEVNINEQLMEEVFAAFANDLNVNEALGKLFLLIRLSNGSLDSGRVLQSDALKYETFWKRLDSILGLGDAVVSIPAEVQALLDQRAAVRQAKNFARSDELRKAIEALGWKVKDTAKGQELSPG
ncbi:MAG TPA: cysteine--tRNA ligase [Candidatus Methylacidiphilales bacterium]|jgi:cysteinyl-tRNA synthetase|nr:cysteine--tRNA ligase [Candidatus Methylacidiphilales bacterium]